MLRLAGVLALGACKFTAHLQADASTDAVDALVIDAPDGPPGLTCYGTGLVKACPTDPVQPTFTLGSNQTIATDSSTKCVATGGDTNLDACFVIATEVTLSNNLRGTGTKPLVVVATDTLTLDAKIDVSSTRTGARGAASGAPGCQTVATVADIGYPGGSFGGAGGNAGNGPPADPALASLAAVRSGCDGTGPKAGQAGGVAWLIAGTQIHLTTNGVILAAGSNGGGGTAPITGGSGGASGGLVGLDAPMIVLDSGAVVLASGGGGGEGADAGANGKNGSDPDPANPTTAAAGGTGNTTGGGDGGSGNDATGNAQAGKAGVTGGGGGGGAGWVQTYGTLTNNGTIVPPPRS